MSTGPQPNSHGKTTDLPPWDECDYFCIHDYAGLVAAPCGWRGRIADVRQDETGSRLLCPRCGCTTLFRIPSDRPGESY
jgi:hypothetical protein